jgi:hypothetical protein
MTSSVIQQERGIKPAERPTFGCAVGPHHHLSPSFEQRENAMTPCVELPVYS